MQWWHLYECLDLSRTLFPFSLYGAVPEVYSLLQSLTNKPTRLEMTKFILAVQVKHFTICKARMAYIVHMQQSDTMWKAKQLQMECSEFQ